MKTAIILLLAAASLCAQIRVNAGGPAYADKAGNAWAKDTAAPNSYTTAAAITGTSDPALYQTEAWNSSVLGYKFSVPNGNYNVTLKFAEIYFTGANQRVFDIVLNGATVESKFDPCAAAGGENIAIDKAYPVTVTGGVIDIQLVSIIENPKISAIDIEPVDAPPSAPAPAPVPTSTATVSITDFATLQTQVSALSTTVAAIQTQVAAIQSAITPAPAPTLPTLSATPPYSDPAATGPEDVLWLKQQILALIQIVQAIQQQTGVK